ncbi:hypothetical protein [Azospirillum argentinense]|uniref:hypothetical protein n=1 Tax=Azospirillum argentinense TaxID=2970906 RepID=UPI0011AEDFA6|nr:hypothetical protein [Azospirillum argentinense]
MDMARISFPRNDAAAVDCYESERKYSAVQTSMRVALDLPVSNDGAAIIKKYAKPARRVLRDTCSMMSLCQER